jgi:hypothetical protein
MMTPPPYSDSDIGKKEGEYTIVSLFNPVPGAAVLMRDLEVRGVRVEVAACELVILDGAMASASCDIWFKVHLELEDAWNDSEDNRDEVQLLHTMDGAVIEFMTYEPRDGEPHMGVSSSAHFRDDQEKRLKFLTKFEMNDSDFDELNAPWEYAVD